MTYSTFQSMDPRIPEILEMTRNLARANHSILIEGEAGTGKAMLASAVHAAGICTSPLVVVDCASFPENAMAGELFGQKGAFAMAAGQTRSRLERARGGTIFMGQIDHLSTAMQAKLLRVLPEPGGERGEGTQTMRTGVRVIAASRRSLRRLVSEGKFREDLLNRLNGVTIELPPLRNCQRDIPLLAAYFAAKFSQARETAKAIAPSALTVLQQYSWPGNIHEFANVIERACISTRDGTIRVDNLPSELRSSLEPESRPTMDLPKPRAHLRKLLEGTTGPLGRGAPICRFSPRSQRTHAVACRPILTLTISPWALTLITSNPPAGGCVATTGYPQATRSPGFAADDAV